MLEGVIPFPARAHYPGSDSRKVFAVGVIPFARAPAPRPAHNKGADPKKTELKKLNSALLLVCWSVSFLFCRVSPLVGRLASGSSFVLVCLGFP